MEFVVKKIPLLIFIRCCFAMGSVDFDATCPNLMRNSSLSPGFEGNVAHGIHSITVEDLRTYFEPTLSTDNKIPIPTIDLDILSPTPVLHFAPRAGTDPRIKTDGFRALDQVLSHMDNPTYDLKNYSVLERLAHVLHMKEMYAHTAEVYKQIKSDPPSDELCSCVGDIDNNGINDVLHFMALKIREPTLMRNIYLRRNDSRTFVLIRNNDADSHGANSADDRVKRDAVNEDEEEQLDFSDPLYKLLIETIQQSREKREAAKNMDWSGNLYKLRFKREAANDVDWSGNLYKLRFKREAANDVDWSGNLYKLRFKRFATLIGKQEKSHQDGQPRLTSESAWNYWKEQALTMDMEGHFDLAMFIYCSLSTRD